MIDRKETEKIARERIKILFDLAEDEISKNPERAKRYVEIARKIGMKCRVSLSGYKHRFCSKCGSYLKVNLTAKKRINKSRIILTCLKCKTVSRYGLGKKGKV